MPAEHFTPRTALTYGLVTEVGNYTHVVEASTLGLRPGYWPDVIVCDRSFGNGCVLAQTEPEFRNGELVAVNYRQLAGVIRLRIFND